MVTIDLNKLNNIQEAKDAFYNGKALTNDFEKNIFDNTSLSPGGTLDTRLLRETALLLEKVKKAEAKLTYDNEAASLLSDLKAASSSNEVPYQVVNSGNIQVSREITRLTTLSGQSPDRYNNKTKEEWETEKRTQEALEKQLKTELSEENKKIDSYAETVGRLKREADAAKKLADDIKLVVDKIKGNGTLNAILQRNKEKNEKVWSYAEDPGDVDGFFEGNVSYGEPKFMTWGRSFDSFSYGICSILKLIDKKTLFDKIEDTSNVYFSHLQGPTNKTKLDGVKASYDKIMRTVNDHDAVRSVEIDRNGKQFVNWLTSGNKRDEFKNKETWEVFDDSNYDPTTWNIGLGDFFRVMENIFPDTVSKSLNDNPLLDSSSSFKLDDDLLNRKFEIKYAASSDGSSLKKVKESQVVVSKNLLLGKVGLNNNGILRLFWNVFNTVDPKISSQIATSEKADTDGDGKTRVKIKREWDNKVMRESLANKMLNIQEYVIGVKNYITGGTITDTSGNVIKIDWTPEWKKKVYEVAKISSRMAKTQKTKEGVEKAVLKEKLEAKANEDLRKTLKLVGYENYSKEQMEKLSSETRRITSFTFMFNYDELKEYDNFQIDADIDYSKKQAKYDAAIKHLADVSSKSASLEASKDQAAMNKRIAQNAILFFSGKTPTQIQDEFKRVYAGGTNNGANNPKYGLEELGTMQGAIDSLIAAGKFDNEYKGYWDDIQNNVYGKTAPHTAITAAFSAGGKDLQSRIEAQHWYKADSEDEIKAKLLVIKKHLEDIKAIRHLGPEEADLIKQIDNYKKPVKTPPQPSTALDKPNLGKILGSAVTVDDTLLSKIATIDGSNLSLETVKKLFALVGADHESKNDNDFKRFVGHLRDKLSITGTDDNEVWKNFLTGKTGKEIAQAIIDHKWEDDNFKSTEKTAFDADTTVDKDEYYKGDEGFKKYVYEKHIGKTLTLKQTKEPEKKEDDTKEPEKKEWYAAYGYMAIWLPVSLAAIGGLVYYFWEDIKGWFGTSEGSTGEGEESE